LLNDLRMVAHRVQDLVTYQFAIEFKTEVYRLIGASATAAQDFRWAAQVRDAASDVEADIAEGFARRNPREFVHFLRYALASLEEAATRLADGAARGHFATADLHLALTWSRRCRQAMLALQSSQRRYADAQDARAPPASRAARRRSKRRRRPDSETDR
jgi:four helix bundle protein